MKKIYNNGCVYYIDNNLYHRVGMPAEVWLNNCGTLKKCYWFIKKAHRINGYCGLYSFNHNMIYNFNIKVNINKLVI